MSYSVRAVVDWIDVQINTCHSTNFQTVRRSIGRAFPDSVPPHVRTINANEGGGGTAFAIRLHNVERYSDILIFLDRLSHEFQIQPGFLIVGKEIAIDVYCDDPALQVIALYKFISNPVSDNRRIYHDYDGSAKAVPTRSEALARQLREGWQIGIGNETDERFQHFYVKNTDTINGQRQDVKIRARFETRLQAAGLPFQTPEEYRSCKFEMFADYFRVREMKTNLEPSAYLLAEATNKLGERRVINRKEGGTRLHNKLTKASSFNEVMRDALRKLSRRWRSSGKRGRNPAKPIACGFSGSNSVKKPQRAKDFDLEL